MISETFDEKFELIKKEYAKLESELKDSGKGMVYRTDKGIYGTTNLNNIFKFFKEINLLNYKNFLDLGCGDGRVVLVASLFTKSTGIEFDKELVKTANKIKDSLKLDCSIFEGDYLKHDFSKYDIIFINPDHDLTTLGEKLSCELNGVLFVYNEIFAPEYLKKGKKFWAGQIPIVSYANLKNNSR